MEEFRNWLLRKNGFASAGGDSWDILRPSANDCSHLNFKKWLENMSPSSFYGGIVGQGEIPQNPTNSNMPVRSKYSTSDSEKEKEPPRKDKDGNPSTVDSEWLGKKRIPLSNRPRERKSMWIDRDKRSIPTRDDRPDIVY